MSFRSSRVVQICRELPARVLFRSKQRTRLAAASTVLLAGCLGSAQMRSSPKAQAASQATAAVQPPIQRHDVRQVWNTSSGLPQDTVRQFLQTKDGYLWMATEGGLVRFDGVEFTVYDKRSAAGMSSDLANGLFEDASGSLWIATTDGLLQHSGNAFRRYSTQDGLPSDTVWATGQDASGNVWAATADGLAHLAGGRFDAWPAPSATGRSLSSSPLRRFTGRLASPFLKAPDGTLWAIATDSVTSIGSTGRVVTFPLPAPALDAAMAADSTLWVATAQSILHVDPSAGVTTLPPLSAAPLNCIAMDPAGTLWAGAADGLYAYHPESGAAVHWRHFQQQDGLPEVHVAKLYADRNAKLWIVTNTGLVRYSKGRFSAGYDQDGFKGDDVLALYQDQDGDLWVGSENSGAAIFRHSAFITLTSREGLPTDVIRSLHADDSVSGPAASGDIWFGTAAGLTRLHGNAFTTFTTAMGLPSDEVLAIAPGAQPQSLWLGTPDGLSLLAGNHATTLTASDGLPDDNIRSLLLSRDHSLWIGTSHGLAVLPHADHAQAKTIQNYTHADGLPSDVIGSMLEDRDGSLWVGTLKGLSRLTATPSGMRVRTYTSSDGLTSSTITALGQDHNGKLWIGTSGGGLFTIRNGSLQRIGSDTDYAAGRLPSVLYGIVEDDTAHLWLSSSTGIYRAFTSELASLDSREAKSAAIAISHFDVADGLRFHDCASGGHPEAMLAGDGRCWFATIKGASVVDTRDRSLDLPPPPVSIEIISVDDTALDGAAASESFHVPAGHARLAFHYAGLSFANPSKVRYRYQLEHFDRNWIEAGTRRTAYYTNIPPGRYTFRVLASINGGDWSAAAATVIFTIAPHFYQTWWFYTLCSIMVAAIAWQLYLYRLRQVELRFNAVLAERGRIAREIHDTLAQDIVGISVQLELVSRLMSISLDKARDQLQQTRALVRKSLAEARSSIWDLRSPAAAAADLPTRLQETARHITRDSRIALRTNIGGTYRPFPQPLEEELLRIAQEAITNAVRHADPQTIRISLVYHATGARLEVQDDGRGFAVPPQKTGPPGHYGIRGMHERAERARATLDIHSTPGSGTIVMAEVPQQ